MFALPPLPHPDTMENPKSNTNGNFQNNARMIIWQNRMYSRKPFDNGIISMDLTTGEVKDLNRIGALANPNFQIWQDKLYLNYSTSGLVNIFAQIDAGGSIEREVAETTEPYRAFSTPLVMQDKSVYYHDGLSGSYEKWIKLDI